MRRRAYIASLPALGIAGCLQGGKSEEDRVEQTLESWYEALITTDLSRLEELLHPNSPDGFPPEEAVESMESADYIDIQSIEIDIEDEEATVTTDLSVGDDGSLLDVFLEDKKYRMRKGSDGWKMWDHLFPPRPARPEEIDTTDLTFDVEPAETVEYPDFSSRDDEVLSWDVRLAGTFTNVGQRDIPYIRYIAQIQTTEAERSDFNLESETGDEKISGLPIIFETDPVPRSESMNFAVSGEMIFEPIDHDLEVVDRFVLNEGLLPEAYLS